MVNEKDNYGDTKVEVDSKLVVDTKALGNSLNFSIRAMHDESTLWYLTGLDISYVYLTKVTLTYHLKTAIYWLLKDG